MSAVAWLMFLFGFGLLSVWVVAVSSQKSPIAVLHGWARIIANIEIALPAAWWLLVGAVLMLWGVMAMFSLSLALGLLLFGWGCWVGGVRGLKPLVALLRTEQPAITPLDRVEMHEATDEDLDGMIR